MKNLFYLATLSLLILTGCGPDSEDDGGLSNNLVSFTVAPNYLPENDVNNPDVTHLLFVTDNEQQLLASTTLQNGMTWTVPRPEGYTENTYGYHIARMSNSGTYKSTRLTSHQNHRAPQVPLETRRGSRLGTSLGTVSVTGSSLPAHKYGSATIGHNLVFGPEIAFNNAEYDIYESRLPFYCYLNNGETGYYYDREITPGENITLQGSMFSTDMDRFSIAVTDNVEATVIATDTRENRGRYRLVYADYPSDFTDSELIFHLPAQRSHYRDYLSYITHNVDDNSYYYSSARSENDFRMPAFATVSATMVNTAPGSINLNINGEYNRFSMEYAKSTDTASYLWIIRSNAVVPGNFPELPQELQNLFPEFSADTFSNGRYWARVIQHDENSEKQFVLSGDL